MAEKDKSDGLRRSKTMDFKLIDHSEPLRSAHQKEMDRLNFPPMIQRAMSKGLVAARKKAQSDE